MGKVLWRRWAYYLKSIVPLLTGVRSPFTVLKAFLRLPMERPFLVQLRTPPLSFKVRGAMDLWILKEVCLEREYERFGFVPQEGWRIVDIGAGLGDYAVFIAAHYPQTHVHAYEPFPDSYALLRENIRLNALENVQTFPTAVGSTAGAAVLEAEGREAVMVQARGREAGGPAGGVPVVPLATVLEAIDTQRCDLLKMDCEGCEYELILQSDPAVWPRISRICLEYHEGVGGHTHGELAKAFQEYDYQVEVFPRRTHPHLGFIRAWRARTEG